MKDGVAAREAYESVIADPDVSSTLHAKAWNFLALLLDAQKDMKGSEHALRKAIELADDIDARENLAALLIDTQRSSEAIALLERILKEDPKRTRSLYHLMRARHPDLVLPAGR